MGSKSSHDELVRVIRSVRRRWRLRVLLRGVAIVLGAGTLVVLASAFGMDHLRFNPVAVTVFRVLAYGALIVLVVRYLLLPLSRRVSDDQVALYLEEHEPELETQLLSAVEFGGLEDEPGRVYSPALVRRMVERAVDRCVTIEYGRRVEAAALARSSGLLAGTTVAALAVLLLSPTFVRNGTPYLFPWASAEAVNPYRIEVVPGDARVARGAELKVEARLHNFDAERVEMVVQRGAENEWQRFPMSVDGETGERTFFLLDLQEATDYFVEAGGIRSATFRIMVVELPYVGELTLEYHYPAYTGLEPRRQEDGGDIAAVEGTEVKVFVTPTVSVAGGVIVMDEGDTLDLAAGTDGVLSGSLRVSQDGLYRIAFETLAGETVPGSPDYLIDVLSDQPPFVGFRSPGRDIKVTNIEEVFTEVEAEDDYGVGSLELVYSVNGGTERTVQLYGGSGSRRDITAGHTFYLEELELEPGDFISYYARASDENRISGRQVATTDIYFMEVRPFDRTFRQADQMPGAGGAGGFDSSLSQQQRDIIAATFNLVRDREEYTEKEFNENLATLALAQGRLREQVEGLVGRIGSRGIVRQDSSFGAVAEPLPKAAEAMREAEELLGQRRPADALSPEQRALQQLQRAEAAFREVQVARGSAGGGGGGGQAEELAELFELELDKQRNQYESIQRERRQQVDQQIDETLQKLQELARRQQQENERQRAQAEAARNRGGRGDSRTQQRLAEETEELARRLERLAREESLPELNRTARELREAAEEMRRASASGAEQGVGKGLSALERLREARRLLDRNRSAGLRRDVDDALRRAERLAQQQREVKKEVERLEDSGSGRRERLERLLERKEEMAGEVADLEAQLDRLARESREDQRDASRELREAANSIRDDKLEDKILYSRGVVQQRSPEYARNFEEQIEEDLRSLAEQLEGARDAIGESREQRLGRTLDEARDLARSLESLEARIGERARSDGEPAQAEAGGGEPQSDAADSPPVAENTADGFPGFSPRDVRQFRREFGERRAEAERLRRQLDREGIDAEELRGIIEGLRRLERSGPYGDVKGLAELQSQIIRDLKEFEYVLRRQLGTAEDRRLLLTGSDEVPSGYREMVEEYYRSLAEEGGANR